MRYAALGSSPSHAKSGRGRRHWLRAVQPRWPRRVRSGQSVGYEAGSPRRVPRYGQWRPRPCCGGCPPLSRPCARSHPSTRRLVGFDTAWRLHRATGGGGVTPPGPLRRSLRRVGHSHWRSSHGTISPPRRRAPSSCSPAWHMHGTPRGLREHSGTGDHSATVPAKHPVLKRPQHPQGQVGLAATRVPLHQVTGDRCHLPTRHPATRV